MHLYVKFVEDDRFSYVTHEDISNFDSKNIDKFKKYMVKWEDGVFYQATIIWSGDSRKEVEELVNNKRARAVNKDLLISDISQDEDEMEERQAVRTLKKPKKIEQAAAGKKSVLKTIMAEKLKSIECSSKVPKGSKSGELQVTGDKGRCLLDQEEKNNLKEEINKLKQQIEKLTIENEGLRNLNMEWQSTAIAKINELSEKLVTNESAANEDLQNTSSAKLPDVGFDDGKEVHLGHGVKIPREAYHSVYSSSKSGQQFVKGIAVCVFGSVQLASSSVTGRPCNRLKKQGSVARPALDSVKLRAIQDIYRQYLIVKGTDEFVLETEVAKVVNYIARKITDLNRPPKGVPKKIQPTPADVERSANLIENVPQYPSDVDDDE